jgi:hypothetical protein
MKLELRKKEGVDGKTWYHVWQGMNLVDSFTNEDDARKCYNDCLIRVKQGFPKVTTLITDEIEAEIEMRKQDQRQEINPHLEVSDETV